MVSKSSSLVFFSLVLFGFVHSNVLQRDTPVLATVAPGCDYHGTHYPVGSFQHSPCEPCQCTSSGKVFCAVVDCFFTQCVNPVHDPKHCCPTCPDGRNCKAPDGTIIKFGDTYHPDAFTQCSCDSHGFGGPHAICAHRVEPVTAAIVS